MANQPKKLQRKVRIKRGIRRKVSGTPERPRLSVYRSNTTIYAQIINDVEGRTLLSVSSRDVTEGKSPNVDVSTQVGKKVAEKAKAAGIEKVVFDRNGYLYHGRVKALAEGAREGGLQF